MTNEVFLLGAGFSKALCPNYPTLKELSDKISESFGEKDENEFGIVDNVLYNYYQQLPLSLIDNNNIEELLTYLASDLPWKDESQKYLDKSLYIYISNLIFTYFQSLKDKELSGQYYQLANYINDNNIPIITFNYDLVLENFIYKKYRVNVYYDNPEKENNIKDFHYHYGFDIENLTYTPQEIKYCSAYPKILKLHGSINWLRENDRNSHKIYNNVNMVKPSQLGDFVPFIVPPVLDKTKFYDNEILVQLWKQAKELLLNAQKIYVIGYSFPTTDIAVRLLFEEVKVNGNIQEIYNVNISPESKYLSKFKKYVCSYSNNFTLKLYGKTKEATPLENFIKDIIQPI